MNRHLFLATSAMPCEVGVGTFFDFIGEINVYEHTIEEANNSNLLKYINIKNGTPASVVLLGTYWIKTLDEAARALPYVYFFMYSSGDVSAEQIASFPENVVIKMPQENNPKSGPVFSILDFYNDMCLTHHAFKALVNIHSRTIKDMEDRILSRNVSETQIFVSGLYNLPHFDKSVSLTKRFFSLFMGEIDRESVLAVGSVILDCQMGMAYERVRRNSKIVKAPNGTRFAVTVSPDLINLSHEQLKIHHQIDKTLVLNLLLNEDDEKLHMSFRSFDDESILPFARAHNGGGSDMAAAARIDFSIPWDRIFEGSANKQ